MPTEKYRSSSSLNLSKRWAIIGRPLSLTISQEGLLYRPGISITNTAVARDMIRNHQLQTQYRIRPPRCLPTNPCTISLQHLPTPEDHVCRKYQQTTAWRPKSGTMICLVKMEMIMKTRIWTGYKARIAHNGIQQARLVVCKPTTAIRISMDFLLPTSSPRQALCLATECCPCPLLTTYFQIALGSR